jgi:hypothetical protein
MNYCFAHNAHNSRLKHYQVTDIYTPPPPSNWGLPDDGRTYSYGRFPRLNEELFGKPRPPRKWMEPASSKRRLGRKGPSSASIFSEQALFGQVVAKTGALVLGTGALVLGSGALVLEGGHAVAKTSLKTGVLVLEATKRGAKNLEIAIHSLSSPSLFRKSSSGELSEGDRGYARGYPLDRMSSKCSVISDITSFDADFEHGEFDLVTVAEQVVWNARRKQVILLGIICKLQQIAREYLARLHFKRIVEEINRQEEMISAPRLRKKSEYLAACRIQGFVRSVPFRRRFLLLRSSIIRLQSLCLMRRTRYAYGLLIIAIVRSQSCWRRCLARRSVFSVVTKRISVYQKHIFSLWRIAETSLGYRTRFWLWLQNTEDILRASVAEDEIHRLWDELFIRPPALPTNKNGDESVATALRLGMSVRMYCKVLGVSSF